VYSGTGGQVAAELAIAKAEARRRRLDIHRAMRCAACCG
jgi:hypothetical protein